MSAEKSYDNSISPPPNIIELLLYIEIMDALRCIETIEALRDTKELLLLLLTLFGPSIIDPLLRNDPWKLLPENGLLS